MKETALDPKQDKPCALRTAIVEARKITARLESVLFRIKGEEQPLAEDIIEFPANLRVILNEGPSILRTHHQNNHKLLNEICDCLF